MGVFFFAIGCGLVALVVFSIVYVIYNKEDQ